MTRREAEHQAEQERRIEEARQQQQTAAAAALEEERARRLRIWIANGGTESEFAEAWPGMRQKIIRSVVTRLLDGRARGRVGEDDGRRTRGRPRAAADVVVATGGALADHGAAGPGADRAGGLAARLAGARRLRGRGWVRQLRYSRGGHRGPFPLVRAPGSCADSAGAISLSDAVIILYLSVFCLDLYGTLL
jgi:hypothetical protein